MHIDPYDVRALRAFHELHGSVPDAGAPVLAIDGAPKSRTSVALLPGSFNPPTAAHVLLAERALREGFEQVILTYARSTVGKQPGGLIPEDRLLAVRCATEDPRLSIGVCSHGLYADQATAAATAFPDADIAFLVGSDKVLQIFEAGWYRDHVDALDRLFSQARLIVAPRADQSEALRELLAAPEHRRWASRVEILGLHPAVSDLSSTRVRGLLRSGADPAGLVPQPVADVLACVRAFMPPIVVDGEEVDVYRVRANALAALWRSHISLQPDDLRALVRDATTPDARGQRLRTLLDSEDPDDHVEALRSIA